MPEGSEHLVEDLFETITLFDNEVAAATSTDRADGTFLVHLELQARKLRADGAGAEREIPIDDWVDVAVFGEGDDRRRGGTVLVLERRRIRASPVTFEIVVGQRPTSGGDRPVLQAHRPRPRRQRQRRVTDLASVNFGT